MNARPEPLDVTPSSLDALERRLQQDLTWLDYPPKSWVPAREIEGARVLDVVIIGGGMAGLAASAMLKRIGVANHAVFDRGAEGKEGPWDTFARMKTLRSPKQLTGPALGLPALTYRAYHEARFGAETWRAVEKIPRQLWMDYLVWYRKVLSLPIVNRSNIEGIDARSDSLLAITVVSDEGKRTVLTRHVVLATGRDGLGGAFVPPIARALDKSLWAHTSDTIDFESLRGKRVAVVGAGASAMDNAATALEAGANVHMLIRRADLPRVNKFTGIGSQGVIHG